MKRSTIAVALLLLALGTALTGCGGSTTGGDTPTAVTGSDTPGAGTTPAATKPPIGTVSGTIATPMPVKDYTITLDSADVADGSLKASFTVDNSKGTGQVSLPGTAFNAYLKGSTTPLDQDLVCTSLVVRIDAGKTTQGFVCWKLNGTTDISGATVRYDAGRLAGTIINWTLP